LRTLHPVKRLSGEITVPGDKSISHRAVMFGSLAKGDTLVRGFLGSADCLSTMDCFQRLGVSIERDPQGPGTLLIHGAGMHGLTAQGDEICCLDTGNSGTTTRIMSGILAPQPFASLLSGDDSVNSRPMKRVMDPLSQMGADITSVRGNGCAPLLIKGRPLTGITYHSPVASAQVKSAILCAGLYAEGPTAVYEPAKSRDHTERMLRAFGADIEELDGFGVRIHPAEELRSPGQITVPGDISSAAYYIAAASIVPGSEVLIRGVGINPTRDGILRAAKAMGADITEVSRDDSGAEPIADLLVRTAPLHGTVIEGGIIPTMIDELPAVCVMAAAADGETIIRDAHELRVKESDRIEAMTNGLRAMGCAIIGTDDGFVIHGGTPLHGATIACHKDHRIAMSFAVASLIADGATVLDNESCVRISYPGFFDDLESLVQE